MATGDRPWSAFPTSTTLDDNSDFVAFVDISQPLPEDRNRTITLDNFASELYTNGRVIGTLAVLNAAVTDATLDDSSDPRPPTAHAADHEVGGSDTVNHDNLVGFVANEHIDHSGVTLTAGEGLAGGGDITASRTFDLDINGLVIETGIDSAADFLAFYDTNVAAHRKLTVDDLEVVIDHDSLAGFVANEHVDHSTVTLTAGEGIAGGGDITASRTFDLDINGLVEETTVVAGSDFLVFYDADAGAHRKVHPGDVGLGGVTPSTIIDFVAGTSAPSISVITIDDLATFEFDDGDSTKNIIAEFTVPDGIDLSTNPVLLMKFTVLATGAGNANADLDLQATYIADGEQTDKAVDETISQSVAVTDVLEQQHEVTFTLDRTLIAASDAIKLRLLRLGGSDAYSGDIGVYDRAQLQFTTSG